MEDEGEMKLGLNHKGRNQTESEIGDERRTGRKSNGGTGGTDPERLVLVFR